VNIPISNQQPKILETFFLVITHGHFFSQNSVISTVQIPQFLVPLNIEILSPNSTISCSSKYRNLRYG